MKYRELLPSESFSVSVSHPTLETEKVEATAEEMAEEVNSLLQTVFKDSGAAVSRGVSEESTTIIIYGTHHKTGIVGMLNGEYGNFGYVLNISELAK